MDNFKKNYWYLSALFGVVSVIVTLFLSFDIKIIKRLFQSTCFMQQTLKSTVNWKSSTKEFATDVQGVKKHTCRKKHLVVICVSTADKVRLSLVRSVQKNSNTGIFYSSTWDTRMIFSYRNWERGNRMMLVSERFGIQTGTIIKKLGSWSQTDSYNGKRILLKSKWKKLYLKLFERRKKWIQIWKKISFIYKCTSAFFLISACWWYKISTRMNCWDIILMNV